MPYILLLPFKDLNTMWSQLVHLTTFRSIFITPSYWLFHLMI